MTKVDTQALKKNYEELNQKMEALKNEMAEQSKIYFSAMFEEFAEKYDFYAITWTQYTPYFNDGDECYFRVNEICLKLTEESYDDDPYECDSWIIRYYGEEKSAERFGLDSITPEMFAAVEAFTNFKSEFGKIDEDYLEMAFGNHVRVTYTKEGKTFEVIEYDHD